MQEALPKAVHDQICLKDGLCTKLDWTKAEAPDRNSVTSMGTATVTVQLDESVTATWSSTAITVSSNCLQKALCPC